MRLFPLASLQVILNDWTRHVSDLRNSHPSLNFFTTDQLVLLSGQLAAVARGKSLSNEATMLLRLVAKGNLEKFIY